MRKIVIFFLLLTVIFFPSLIGLGKEMILIGSFTAARGKVEIQRGGEESWEKAGVDIPIYPGDKVRTGPKSEAELILDDGSMLRIEERTQIEIIDSRVEEGDEDGVRKTFFLNLWAGKVLSGLKKLIHQQSMYKVSTKTAVVGVRGTEFSVEVEKDTTGVAVYEGEVDVTSEIEGKKTATVRVKPGQETFVRKGRPPRTPKALSERSKLYRKLVLLRFRKRVERNRARLAEIRKRRALKIRLMHKKVEDFKKRYWEKMKKRKQEQSQD